MDKCKYVGWKFALSPHQTQVVELQLHLPWGDNFCVIPPSDWKPLYLHALGRTGMSHRSTPARVRALPRYPPTRPEQTRADIWAFEIGIALSPEGLSSSLRGSCGAESLDFPPRPRPPLEFPLPRPRPPLGLSWSLDGSWALSLIFLRQSHS